MAVNLNQWLIDGDDRWSKQASKLVDAAEVKEVYYQAVESMATLNLNATSLMKKYGAHGATDITGFGLKGHAQNLVNVQKKNLDFRFALLPLIRGMDQINNSVLDFKLMEGLSAETSGGLLIMLPEDKVQGFQDELREEYGQHSWQVGFVTPG